MAKGTPQRQPRLYVLCGLPFAGKSTLARALVRRFGWVHIELDHINATHGRGVGGVPIPPEEWDQTYAESYRQVEDVLNRGQSVIYDARNFTRTQRDRLRSIGLACSASAVTIYVDVPESEAHRRWVNTRKKGERRDVRNEDIVTVTAFFEPPTSGEPDVVRYDGSTLVDEWLEQVRDRLGIELGK